MQKNYRAERHIKDNEEKNRCSETGVENQRKKIYMRVQKKNMNDQSSSEIL